MTGRRRLLIAATQVGYAHVKRALSGYFDLVPVFKHAEALRALEEQDLDAIVCSIHFDESRMFDLLMAAKAELPATPFICCQMLVSHLSAKGVGATAETVLSQGAVAFIDYNAVLRTRGASEADQLLRDELERLLPPRSDLAIAK